MRYAKIIDFATNGTRWSSLKNFTNSRAAQLTILAPFIGYLIVFNSELRTYLNLSFPEKSNTSLVNWLRAHSLTFLATAIFAMSCPNKIRENKNIIEYVQKMEDVKTPNLVRRHLSNTIYLFFRHNSGERSSPLFSEIHPSFPHAAAAPLHLLVEALAASGLTEEETIVSFQTGSGYWMTDEIMEAMSGERRVDKVFWMPLFDASFELSKEVFYVSYRVDDFRMFVVRLLNFSLFVLGLVFLGIPTIVTIVAVIVSLI